MICLSLGRRELALYLIPLTSNLQQLVGLDDRTLFVGRQLALYFRLSLRGWNECCASFGRRQPLPQDIPLGSHRCQLSIQ